MELGYVRTSSVDQNEERQVLALINKGVEKGNIFIDKKSGKDTDREAFQNMLNFCRKGDTIITESISRIARNTKDFLNTMDYLEKKQVEFISMKENIDTSAPTGKFMLTVFSAMYELERDNIRDRQREGFEIRKAKGLYRGKAKMQIDKNEFRKVVSKWRTGEITAVSAMKKLNLKPNTFYRRVKEWEL
ncbi:MAG: recombinase family protein [Ruminococcaceae bacterium]|nr:recombinase family protein [Oscillospiraceae bacterium]